MRQETTRFTEEMPCGYMHTKNPLRWCASTRSIDRAPAGGRSPCRLWPSSWD